MTIKLSYLDLEETNKAVKSILISMVLNWIRFKTIKNPQIYTLFLREKTPKTDLGIVEEEKLNLSTNSTKSSENINIL